MALLSLDKRQQYFNELGFGEYNAENILKLQRQYFTRKRDLDGIYGPDTDNLLRHVYNCSKVKNFEPHEFKCECNGRWCTGYPSYMKENQLAHLQAIRDHFGRPMIITSGMRCKGYNSALGSASIVNSKHLTGQATDFYTRGVTDTLANRKMTISWIKQLPNHTFSYGNGINSYGNYVSAPYMGNALHTDTK